MNTEASKSVGDIQRPKTVNKGGRPKGSPNKATALAREGIAKLVEANVPKMGRWLSKIEDEHGPLVAMRLVTDLLEFHIPKLQRSEVTGVNINLSGLHLDALRAPQSAQLVERMHQQALGVSSRVVVDAVPSVARGDTANGAMNGAMREGDKG